MMRYRVFELLDVNITPRPITEAQSAEVKRLLDHANDEEIEKLSHRFQVESSEWVDEWTTGRRPVPGTGYTVGDWVRHKETGFTGTVTGWAHPGVIVDWGQSSTAAFRVPTEIHQVDQISPVDPLSPAAVDAKVIAAPTRRELQRVRTDLHEMKRELEEDV